MPSGNAVMPETVEICHTTPEIASAANEANVASSKPREEISLPSAAIPWANLTSSRPITA